MVRGSRILAFSGLLVAALSTSVVIGGRAGRPLERTEPSAFVVAKVSREAVDETFIRAAPYVKNPAGRVRAGVLPHHALVAPMLAAFFRGFGEQSPPATTVIVGPDHKNVGRNYVTTTRRSWQTPDGLLETDERLVDALVAEGQATIDDQLIEQEHGVWTILPYLKRVFPRTRIVQLAIRGDLRSERIDELSRSLRSFLGPNDIVVASVDFSHYKDVAGAWSDDAVSLPAIRHGDPEQALTIPVDSPPAISLLLRLSRDEHLILQELVHTNSAEFSGDLSLPSTTSYFSAYFLATP